MDIQAIINKLVEKVKAEPDVLAKIKEDPIKEIEALIGEVIPKDAIQDILNGLKEKLGDGALKDVEEKLTKHGGIAGIFDSIKKLF